MYFFKLAVEEPCKGGGVHSRGAFIRRGIVVCSPSPTFTLASKTCGNVHCVQSFGHLKPNILASWPRYVVNVFVLHLGSFSPSPGKMVKV
jgi:hypothetical protein